MTEINARIHYLGTNPSEDFPVSLIIFVSFAVNCLIFYLLPSSITPLNKSYVVSTVHACASVLAVCLYFLYSPIKLIQVDRILGGGIDGTYDNKMAYSVCYSGGYFIYDLLLMAYFKSVRSAAAMFHHIIVLMIGLSGLYTRVGHTSHFLMLFEELSTIPLNVKAIFHQHSDIHSFCALLFAVTFLWTRLIYGSIICFYVFRALPKFIRLAEASHDTTSVWLSLLLTALSDLPTNETIVPELLKSIGYRTAMHGKWDLGHRPPFHPSYRRFDEYIDIPGGNHPPVKVCSKDPPYRFEQKHEHPVDLRKITGDIFTVGTPLCHSVNQTYQLVKDLNVLNQTLLIFTSDNGPVAVEMCFDGIDLSPVLFDGSSQGHDFLFHTDEFGALSTIVYNQYKAYYTTYSAIDGTCGSIKKV
ncbi:unnamed protein product [Adineta ricciae]|uniref:TLC domain-containing protein n=1 Tax=Adineta ricciae TaxID=249248 RepID=A0A814QM43_ADIRI|nr:unnamed protein product [Adineta ricciae]